MPGPTEEELNKLREKNNKLRAQIADAESQHAERVAESAREIEYAQLQAEQVRLEAQLANVRELAKVGSVKAGSENVVAQAKEQLAQAVAVAEQTPGPVDTNADNKQENGGNS